MGSLKHAPGHPCCDADGSVFSACCQSYNTTTFPDGGFLKVPASQVVDTDCTVPDFGSLIAEVNGDSSSSCNINGSYSVPNSAACVITGIGAAGSCVWSGRYDEICQLTVSTGLSPFGPHVIVLVGPGLIRAWVGIHNLFFTCNTADGFGGSGRWIAYARFELTYDGSSIPDFSNPTNIPCVQVFGSSPVWDISEPLVVYF